MKKTSFFRKTPQDDILDLVLAYKHKDDAHNDGTRSHVLAQGIDELFTYIVTYGVRYGIISSADLSYFVWDRNDVLHISQGVEWQNQKFVVLLSYFLEMAAKDCTAYAGKKGKWPAYDYLIIFVLAFKLYFVICSLDFFDNVYV